MKWILEDDVNDYVKKKLEELSLKIKVSKLKEKSEV